MTGTGQPSLATELRIRARQADDQLLAVEDLLNVAIDGSPDQRVLMELLDMATDARESLRDFEDLLREMKKRDE